MLTLVYMEAYRLTNGIAKMAAILLSEGGGHIASVVQDLDIRLLYPLVMGLLTLGYMEAYHLTNGIAKVAAILPVWRPYCQCGGHIASVAAILPVLFKT